MSTLFRPLVCCVLLALAAVVALGEPTADRCLGPYFAVKSGAEPASDFPLRSTSVTAEIAGPIAEVHVVQTYENRGKAAIEATYVFPASTRAAVHGLTMTLGGRRVVAQVKERGEARRNYELAKAEGKTASLLEEQRPNVFQMNLANILPGDLVEVELAYSELLVPSEGTYEFVYLTTVGPRYSNRPAATAASDEKWVANPYLPEGSPAVASFALEARVVTGMPLHEVTSPSHRVGIDFRNAGEALVQIAPDEPQPANRDFILRYRMAAGAIQTGLLIDPPSQPGADGHFLLMLEGPTRPAVAMVPPRDFLFVVDVSGSMHGFPIDTAKALVRELAARLRPVDSFNVLLFAGDSRLLSPTSLPASPDNVAAALALLDQQSGGGGTELLAAMRRALAVPGSEGTRIIAVVTDGYVDIEPELFELVRANLGRSSLFAFGIGSAVNRHLIEGLARAGRGEPFVVTDPAKAEAGAVRFREMIESPVLTEVKVTFEGWQVDELAPWPVPDVFARRPVVLAGRYRGEAGGKVRVCGRSGDSDWHAEVDASEGARLNSAGLLGRLWARQRIAELADMQELKLDYARKAEVTQLGLRFNLLTKYTSFIAIDELVRRTPADPLREVAQPSVLPEGVTNLAVGGGDVATAPEPATLLLLGTAVLCIVASGLRRYRKTSEART
jgi:Ca-activated chloride channel family protein